MPEKMDPGDSVKFLSMFERGVIQVLVNGKPLARVDANSHQIDAEVSGINETGIKMNEILPKSAKKDKSGLLKTLHHTADALHDEGWSLHVYDKGKKIMSAGNGVSGLTGHLSVNILHLGGLIDAAKTLT